MSQATVSSGVRLHYRDENLSGVPPVLLLHGLGASGGSWEQHVSWLAEAGYRVLAPDLRGFGQSSYPGHTSIPELARDVADLLRQTKAAPAHVVGISLGGTVAQQLALDNPSLVCSLVLVNTFARLRPDRAGSWLYLIARLLLVHTLGLRTQARLVARHMFPRPEQEELRRELIEQVAGANPRGYRATMRALWRFDVENRLGEIRVPTLVVTGVKDRTVSPRNQQVLVNRIPGARQVVVPEANHAISTDQPETFRSLLSTFLNEQRPPRTPVSH